MSFWRTLWYLFCTTVAIAAMSFGAAITYSPELLPPKIRLPLQTATEGIEPQTVLIWLGGIVALGGVIALWIWRNKGSETAFFDPDAETSNREVPVAGHELTDGFEHSNESDRSGPGYPIAGIDAKKGAEWANASLSSDSVREVLRGVLREVYRTDFDSRSEVETYLDRGEWTSDRYAAAFISSSREIDYPLRHRIVAWLYPDRARQFRVRRVLREVESIAHERFSLFETADARQRSGIERLKALLGRSDGSER